MNEANAISHLFQLSLGFIVITMAVISFAASFTFATLFQIYGASLTVFNEITRNLSDLSKQNPLSDLSFYRELVLRKHKTEEVLKVFHDDTLKKWRYLLRVCVMSIAVGIGSIILTITKIVYVNIIIIPINAVGIIIATILFLLLMQVCLIIQCINVGNTYKPSVIIEDLRKFKQNIDTDLNSVFSNINKEVK